MNATEILEREHALVRRLLSCLGALVDEAERLGSLDRVAASSVLALFERFVDWSHQDKEELHLFPRMLTRVTAAEESRLEGCLEDHAKERRRLVGMWLHLDGACNGETLALERFCANALLYIRLQRKHVDEEESYVLPLAESVLEPEDDRSIQRGYEEIDRRLGAPRDVERSVGELCRRFRIAEPGADGTESLLAG